MNSTGSEPENLKLKLRTENIPRNDTRSFYHSRNSAISRIVYRIQPLKAEENVPQNKLLIGRFERSTTTDNIAGSAGYRRST